MKAAYIREVGPAENIVYGDLPQPELKGSHVLVKVAAVSVNPVDTYIRGGKIAWELPKPFVLGCDLAGTVEAVGPNVTRLKPGDRVWGSNQGLKGRQGTFAEYAAVDESWLYSTPPSVADRDAAAIALVGITAHLGLFSHAKLRRGETIFVHGGSGGVGSCVVQMAKAVGARVITTAGSDEKAEVCRHLGADAVIRYKTQNEAAAIHEFAPEGVNVWWETLREPNFEQAVALLSMRGRIVLMAGRDAKPQFPVGPFYTRDGAVHGFAMFNASAEEQRAAADEINRWLAEGKLHARVSRVMRLAETAEAHRLQEQSTLAQSGALAGKIVLEP
ncbi:MAG: NADPH:quinone reductase [Thermoguttaceae bacterium]